jgi:HSP20 family protein
MTLSRFSESLDPVSRLLALQHELERAFENPPGWDLGVSGRGVFPPVNVFGDADGCVVRLEVPGVAPEHLSIESQGRTLTIKGKREVTAPAGGGFHRRERATGEFSRSIRLPEDVDPGRAEATYKHGILIVRIPKNEAAKARQITVKAA